MQSDKVRNICGKFTQRLYEAICRSLFVKDKLLFSYLVCIKIMTGEDRID
jgi:dynein heavy chain